MVLEIMFTGLIAFVKDDCALNDAKKMDIVMVKAEKHLPRLVVDMRHVKSSTPDPDEIVELPGGAQLAIWNLDNKQIKVVDAPRKIEIYEGHRRKTNDDNYIEPGPGQLDRKADFSWAPELRRACGLTVDNAYPRPEVKANNRLSYTSSAGQLVQFAAARFAELEIQKTGPKPKRAINQLETEIIGLEQETSKVFKFKQDDPYKQVLADRARLRMEMKKDNLIEIRLNTLSTADADVNPVLATTIRLKPDPSGVFVAISNLPNVVTPEVGLPEKVLHFHEYEKLLANDQITCPVPTEDLGLTKESGQMAGVQPVKCTLCSTCGGPD